MKNIIYKKDNIYLKPFSKDELTDEYRSWFHNPDITKYNSHGLFPYTKNQMEKFLDIIENGSNDEIIFAIYAKKIEEQRHIKFDDSTLPNPVVIFDYIHIGNCSIQRINYIDRSAELAWIVGNKDYWGKGIATQTGQFMLQHCFEKLNLNRVWTGTVKENLGMRKVCEKLGMVQEGEYRQGSFLNGEYHNIIAYAILKQEYDLISPNIIKLDKPHQEPNFYTQIAPIIDQIESIRKGNNTLWMDILRVAFENDPDRTKKIFRSIVNNDRKINELSENLCK